MDYRKGLLSLLVIPVFVAGAVESVHAAGFALFTQGASALGQGNAVTAHNDSPNAIFYNPALMAKLDGTQVDVGTTLVYASHDFKSNDGGSSSSNSDVFFPSTFYVTHKINDSFTAGFGVFNPFGLGTHWSEGWEGRYQATKSDLTTFNFNPVVSYRILPSLSVAAGLDVIYLDATLERKFPGAPFGIPSDLNAKFDGDGTGVGYNVAAAYDVTSRVSVGVSYRSHVDIDIDGTSHLGNTSSKGHTHVKLPAQLTAGVSYQVTDPLIIEAGIRWEEWSSFKNLTITLDTPPPVVTQRNWHDTLGANVGGKYRLSDIASLSAGYIYGSNAVPSYTFDPSIPDADTHIFCAGASFDLRPWRIDLAYAYQLYKDRTKNNEIGSTVSGTPIPASPANGEYQSDAHLFAINLGYRF